MKDFILIFLFILILWFKFSDLFSSRPKKIDNNNTTKLDERIISICTYENNGKYNCKDVNMTMEEYLDQKVETKTFKKTKELKQIKLFKATKQKELNNSISNTEQDNDNEKSDDDILNFIYENDS